jgi:hypothetical protein
MARGTLEQAIAESQFGDQVLHITCEAAGATQLGVHQTHVKATPPASGTHTIKLPPVAQAKWRIYVIESVANATGDITIATMDDDFPVLSDVVLTTTSDILVVMSIGSRWITLKEVST